MHAVWFDRQGPAAEVLRVGELPDPAPGPGEVRVRVRLSGINPGHQEAPGLAGLGHAIPAGGPAQRRRRDDRPGRRRGRPRDAASAVVTHAVALDGPDPAAAVREHAPEGVERIVEVAFSADVDPDAAVARNNTVIAAYGTRDDRPGFPFWPMLFDNVSIRLLGSDDFPAEAGQQAAADLTAAVRDGALTVPIGPPLSLERSAEAHERVDAGARGRVLPAIPD